MNTSETKRLTYPLVSIALAAALAAFMAGTARAADTDSDGIDDAWEVQYFGNLSRNGLADSDSDGFSDYAEYVFGSNPTVDEPEPMYLAAARWVPSGLGGGGAQYNPVPAPNNPNLMYGNCDMGGFYRSTDGGRRWEMVNGKHVNGVGSYRESEGDCGPVFNLQNENIALVSRNGGLARTADGGLTWTKVSTVTPRSIAFHGGDGAYAVFGGQDSRFYESANYGATWTEDTGWRSTGVLMRQLFVDPNSAKASATIYASTAQGIYKSTNGGTSWTAKNSGLPSTDIWDLGGGLKGGALVLYCIAGTGDGNSICKSTNGGDSWTTVMTGLPAVYYGDLGVAYSNADVVYAGCNDWDGGPTVYKTTDGGASWALVMVNPNNPGKPAGMTIERTWQTVELGWGWGGDPHHVNVCATDPNIVALAEDGRTWRSNDGGTTWFCCNSEETAPSSNWWRNAGFGVTTCYKYVVDPRDPQRHYICYTDIGFARSVDGGASWRYAARNTSGGRFAYSNTFYEIACDPTVDGRMWAATSNTHDLPSWSYVGRDPNTFTGGVGISNDWGAGWADVGHSSGLPTGAVTSILVDPASNPASRTVYAVVFGKGVYKSTDGGTNWTQKNTGLTMGTANTNIYRLERTSDGTLYCAITHRRLSDGTRLKGGLFKSTNGADSWTLVNTNFDLYYIMAFSIDPTDSHRIYVGLAHPGGGINCAWGIARSTDGGANWQNVSTIGVTWHVVADPEYPSRVWAGVNCDYADTNGNGIYMSENGGTTWTKAPTFPFTNIGGIRPCFDPADSQNLYMTTYGGDIFTARVPHPVAPTAGFDATPATGEAPLDVAFDSSASTGEIAAYTWQFGDGAVSHEASPSHTYNDPGTYNVTLKVEGVTGTATHTSSVTISPSMTTDSDGDGLPDLWELEHFGDLDETAAGDPDGDGITNGDEYAGGTDPTQTDNQAPALSGLATVPNRIRHTVDQALTLSALADDRARGNSRVTAAEYFVGAAGAAGTGTAMTASDGVFDSSAESVEADINASAWSIGTVTLYVRARDTLGHWTGASSIAVEVVDGTPPAAVNDLALEVAGQFEPVASEAWSSAGDVTPGIETLTIDLAESQEVGALSMSVGADLTVFPAEFTISGSRDGGDWTVLAKTAGLKAKKGGCHLWQFAPDDYRYVKIDAMSRYSRKEQYYLVRAADVTVYRATDSNRLRATWKATADDGASAASGAASEYDLRYSGAAITGANFAAATKVTTGVPVPGDKGTKEEAEFSIGALSGTVYAALKAGDEVPNWSDISNVASAEVSASGLSPVFPHDAVSAAPDPRMQFVYLRGGEVKPAVIAVSDRPDFPAKPVKSGAITSKTIRTGLKPLLSYWKPSTSQWKAIKALASNSGTLYWRLEGATPAYAGIYTATRSILFDAGMISGLTVTNSHDSGGKEAVWPVVLTRPVFTWTNATVRMKYCFVDISIDPLIPIKEKAKTVILSCGETLSGPRAATESEWKAIRKLARLSNSTLYWRVRILDTDKVYPCASAVKELLVDGGEWSLDPLDLSAATPAANWSNAGDGLVYYRLEFCADDSFSKESGSVLVVPARSVAATSYTLSESEKTALAKFAAKKGVTTLYWRVRGEDGEKLFSATSTSTTCVLP